jgi:agmatinase
VSEARRAPRYTGVRTFAGLPQIPAGGRGAPAGGQLGDPRPAGPLALVLGVPFDTATSWRPGARFGPEAIRSASTLLRPWHPGHGLDVFAATGAADGGDVAITPGNAERSADQIAQALSEVCGAGAVPLVLGGDHSVLLGELRAQTAAHGAPGVVVLDAHADTWDDYYGERLFHGTVLRRAVEERVIDPERSLIAGLRGPLYADSDLADARALGFELVSTEELRGQQPQAFAARVRERIAEGPAFLSFDVDVIDPSAAPGTGTPEVGGLAAAEALALLRALAGVRFTGFDVVEVAPPYDSPGQITSLLAANVGFELLALAALAGA